MVEELDLKKQYKNLYQPSAKQPVVVDVPEFNFVLYDGMIQPGEEVNQSQDFADAMSALYGISYTLKFQSKQRAENPIDYPVMALEGLWWLESGVFDFTHNQAWFFTVMIMQPDHITPEMYQKALADLHKKKPEVRVDKLRFEKFHEGLSVQVMHIGPFSTEPATLERMDKFASENGYEFRGKHHEIYLNDPLKTAPERMKTVLRHPVYKK